MYIYVKKTKRQMAGNHFPYGICKCPFSACIWVILSDKSHVTGSMEVRQSGLSWIYVILTLIYY